LISMMYHHVDSDRCSNQLALFKGHIAYISNHFESVFPTFEPLPKNAICLVFDDGYYDFYRYIYPVLKQYRVKALLAVIPKFILDDTDKSDEVRLRYEHNELFSAYKNATFCTYRELKEMQESGLVKIVSHSYSHKNLLDHGVDVCNELSRSKQILEEKLGIDVETFVFPYGKYDQKILDETLKHYRYVFRIGNGVNRDFHGVNGVIYRIDGDDLKDEKQIFNWLNMLKYKIKTLSKMIVGNR